MRERETFILSGGEKQKVALAGILAMRPSILLIDEPLASLDPASAQETLNIVRQLANDGMTILMVEHRVDDVLNIQPERVMFMSEGEIRYLGNLSGLTRIVNYREGQAACRRDRRTCEGRFASRSANRASSRGYLGIWAVLGA